MSANGMKTEDIERAEKEWAAREPVAPTFYSYRSAEELGDEPHDVIRNAVTNMVAEGVERVRVTQVDAWGVPSSDPVDLWIEGWSVDPLRQGKREADFNPPYTLDA